MKREDRIKQIKMKREDRIKQIKRNANDDREAIGMILSVCADLCSKRGVMLSVSRFDEAAEFILDYLKLNKKDHN